MTLMNESPRPVTQWLNRRSPAAFAAYAIVAAFGTYFCMYAFRKPFSAATYAGYPTWRGLDLKTVYVISQIMGYALSKVIGIRVCSQVTAARRAALLIGCICFAEVALLLFAVLPPQWKIVAIFMNGLPLGMVWGLVVRYLEGRMLSEVMLAGLSCSYILSSGIVKDIGRAWIAAGVPDAWMPVVTGLCFLPVFVITVWMLNQLPRPTEHDVKSRVERTVMVSHERWAFFRRFLPGLVMLLAAYFLFCAYRDYRDNYGIEIFIALGYDKEPAIFSKTEFPVAIGVMIALATINVIRDHRNGLLGTFAVMASGLLLMLSSTLALDAGWLAGHEVWWVILVGLGSYMAYVPFGTALFERLIASTRARGNAVFGIYLADAVGYSGSITIQLFKDLGGFTGSRFEFFRGLSYVVSIFGLVMFAASCLYFLPRTGRDAGESPEAESVT